MPPDGRDLRGGRNILSITLRPAAYVLVASLAVSAFAQQPLIEKIEVSIVNVDVKVTDRAGHAVRGLTRDDFRGFR